MESVTLHSNWHIRNHLGRLGWSKKNTHTQPLWWHGGLKDKSWREKTHRCGKQLKNTVGNVNALRCLVCLHLHFTHFYRPVTCLGRWVAWAREKSHYLTDAFSFFFLFIISFYFIPFFSLSLSLSLFCISLCGCNKSKWNMSVSVYCIYALTVSAFLSICFAFRFPRVQMYFALPTSHICALMVPLTVAIYLCVRVGLLCICCSIGWWLFLLFFMVKIQ